MHSTCLLQGALKVPFHVPIMRHTRPCGQLWESLPIAGNGAIWVSSVILSEDIGLSLHILKPALLASHVGQGPQERPLDAWGLAV